MIQLLIISILSFAQGPAPAAKAEAQGPAPAAKVEAQGPAPAVTSEVPEESFVTLLTRPFIYDLNGKRDPFSPPEKSVEAAKSIGLFGPLLLLQEVRLDDVKVKGIILDPLKSRALIRYPDPNKANAFISTRIAVRDYLGENFGVVSAIRDGQVIIVQTLEQGDKKSTTTRTLSIRK